MTKNIFSAGDQIYGMSDKVNFHMWVTITKKTDRMICFELPNGKKGRAYLQQNEAGEFFAYKGFVYEALPF